MKIRFVQSGGFAGLVKGCELDTQELAPDEASVLHELVAGCGISTSGRFLSKSARDLQQYEITIEKSGTRIALVCDDETAPPTTRPLLHFLKQRARPRSPG